MLSLIELERAGQALEAAFAGGRVERWVEPDRGQLAFSIYRRDERGARKATIAIDARPLLAHLGIVDRMPTAPTRLPAFSAYLRAHLSRARLESVGLRGADRQLALRFSARDGDHTLLLSILGRRSNLYLLNAEDRLVMALRSLEETRGELEIGEPYVDPSGSPPGAGTDRFAEDQGLELLRAIARRYAGDSAERSIEDDRRRLLAAAKKERKSLARRLARIEAELAEADEATLLERQGELLKANLGRIEAGATSLSVADFETGRPVEIPLDPRKSPKANLDAIFKRYQKLLRRLTKAGGQVDSARAALETLDALEREVSEASDPTALLEREDVARLLRRQTPGAAKAGAEARREAPALPAAYRNLPRKLHPRRYRSLDGLEIWVGRSDEANDVLSTRLARGKDLFFHLDGAPGSHVVLRTEGREDPPSESLLDACELAVHFSKQKNAGRADVHVVPIKNVKKPKGAKRGLVYVTGGKSIHLRREAARLERLLASRIEE